ncbi:diaminopimelate decarboxylase [Streptomyces inusitatus]|uniref:Diaminopimelate decarboxylase n=1 Tax=Streptomyces inusitatus TaxID=68221 RepID=A0A918UYW2_9ACTN|nr:type III PLP-dependent enzyme [Streptomyces inusitatus]GGZ46597.1 diaminopimelate decarboxylase [Streptomyces inusitatus]
MNAAELHVQGVPVSRLAERYGTPLFVYDAEELHSVHHRLRELLHPAVDIFFSLKANPNISICAYLNSLGAGAELSSAVELLTARRAGVDPADMIFLGPGKTREELRACLDAGISAIVCESLAELRVLDGLAEETGRTGVPVLLRINPDFAGRGTGLTMGGKPRQFGIDAETLRGARTELAALRRIRVTGFHAYMGTRFLDPAHIVANTRQILDLAEELSRTLGIPLETVDIGGGLGVAYFDNEKDFDLGELTGGLNAAVEPFVRAHPGCRLITELGRYLTATAGRYVTRALYVKESMGETFVVADGGTNHIMPAVGIGGFVKRNFPIRSLSRYDAEPTHAYTVTGPLCTPSDVIAKRVALPAVEPGDLIGVERAGAYGPSASPGHFLSHGFPAEVLVHRGVPHLVRERDTAEDLLARQRLVDLDPDPDLDTARKRNGSA